MGQVILEELESRIDGYEILEIRHQIDDSNGKMQLTVIGNYQNERTATAI